MSGKENEAGLDALPGAPAFEGEESESRETPADSGSAGGRPGMDFVIDVPLRVTVEIGSASMLVRDVLQLGRGSVIPLDRMSGDPADNLANGRVIAKGELTVVDDRLAVRVTQLMGGVPGEGAR